MRLPATILFSLLHFHLISSFAIIHKPATNLITLPTTNLTLTSAPNSEAQCVRITNPPMVGLKPTDCEAVMSTLCQRLAFWEPDQLRRDVWLWTELPGCALGYYLPTITIPPSWGQCHNAFQQIVELCSTDSKYNAGSLNVAEMPDFSGSGRPITEGETMWAMAPERLTLPFSGSERGEIGVRG